MTSADSTVASLNVGLPRDVEWNGRIVTTAIFKHQVEVRLPLRTLNLDGDRQADLNVHGGRDKAVYCYPLEHYEFWKRQMPSFELPMGSFGENLTTTGLREDSIHAGDRLAIGSAEVVVTQPRMPCYKLGVRFQSDAMVKRFLASRRSGFYVAVTKEGDVGAGDVITVLSRDANAVSIAELVEWYVAKTRNPRDVERALRVQALPEGWKEDLRGA